MSFELLNFESLGDDRGLLVALEANREIPFQIKRIYYIADANHGTSRGFHAHRELKQVAVCVSGSCRFVLDDGKKRVSVVLDHATRGLLIDGLTWREMYDFSDDCVLLVIASDYYKESDYIRDYAKFLEAL